MTDLEKAAETPRSKAVRTKKKPPTQTAGVSGIDGHGGMGEAPIEPATPSIDWQKLIALPAFEMFAQEQSGLTYGVTISNWIKERRAALSDSVFYDQYAKWHRARGYWPDETPMGELIQEVK